jgi:hypothetical protein
MSAQRSPGSCETRRASRSPKCSLVTRSIRAAEGASCFPCRAKNRATRIPSPAIRRRAATVDVTVSRDTVDRAHAGCRAVPWRPMAMPVKGGGARCGSCGNCGSSKRSLMLGVFRRPRCRPAPRRIGSSPPPTASGPGPRLAHAVWRSRGRRGCSRSSAPCRKRAHGPRARRHGGEYFGLGGFQSIAPWLLQPWSGRARAHRGRSQRVPRWTLPGYRHRRKRREDPPDPSMARAPARDPPGGVAPAPAHGRRSAGH